MRTIARVLSVVLLLPVVMLAVLAVVTPITVSGVLYLVGTGAAAIGIVSVSWGHAKYRSVFLIGLGLIIAVAIVRVLLLSGPNKIKMLTLPGGNTPCLLNCLLDEQDIALFSTRILSLSGGISAIEQAGLMDAMYSNYRALATAQALVPSPFFRTYLKQQNPNAFDAVVIEPDKNPPVEMGVIFLHGFTGNFTMPCWLVARAVSASQAVTVCPSVGWRGDWWTSDGETTLRATIDYLHQRGVSRIYLAGLSNGAMGASELAYKLTGDIAGLILISGASPDARASDLPVLVIVGSHDERMPPDMMRAYADRMGSSATFVELQADHFMLAKDFEEVQDAIALWLGKH